MRASTVSDTSTGETSRLRILVATSSNGRSQRLSRRRSGIGRPRPLIEAKLGRGLSGRDGNGVELAQHGEVRECLRYEGPGPFVAELDTEQACHPTEQTDVDVRRFRV